MIKCPVCGDECKEGDFSLSKDICNSMFNRCFWYLSPDAGGKDYGNFMARERRLGYSGLRTMEIRPRGFWCDSIKIDENFSIFADFKSKINVEIHWSGGGRDGSVDSIQTAVNFGVALKHAVLVAEVWKVDNEMRGN